MWGSNFPQKKKALKRHVRERTSEATFCGSKNPNAPSRLYPTRQPGAAAYEFPPIAVEYSPSPRGEGRGEGRPSLRLHRSTIRRQLTSSTKSPPNSPFK